MSYCPRCGNSVEENAVYCGNCGSKLRKTNRFPKLSKKIDSLFDKLTKEDDVDPIKYFFIGLRKYFCFAGGTKRKDFFIYFLYEILLKGSLFCIFYILDTYYHVDLTILGYVTGLFFIIPNISICVRRMHDVGKKGWILFIPIVPILYCFMKSRKMLKSISKQERVLGKVCCLILFIVYLILTIMSPNFYLF